MPNTTPLLYKIKLLLMFLMAYSLFYVYPNFSSTGSAVTLNLNWIDLNVPFMPWTFIVYTSDYYFFAVVILMLKDKSAFKSFARLMFGTLIVCGMFFIFYPTTYPRPHYPEVENSLLNFLMKLVGSADTPNNCFPSMHVALTCSATWSIRSLGKKHLWFFSIWTFLVILSTLTTKQHYLVDIFGGLAVSLFVCSLEKHFCKALIVEKNVEKLAL